MTFTYRVEHQASWAKHSAVLKAFPSIQSVLGGSGKREVRRGVKLTSRGWEAKGLSFTW